MERGRSPTVLLAATLAILAVVVAYLTFVKRPIFFALGSQQEPSSPAAHEQATSKTAGRKAAKDSKPSAKAIDWKALIPSVRAALKEGFPYEDIERRFSISIDTEADITGDGVPEALVSTGDGGAYTMYLALVRIEAGKPVAALFKTQDGKVAPYLFLAGASAGHGVRTEMVPDKGAIFLGRYERSDTGPGFNSCSATTFRWNSETKVFDWDRDLSKEITKTYCERALKALPKY